MLFPLAGATWSAGAKGSPGPSWTARKCCRLFVRLSVAALHTPRAFGQLSTLATVRPCPELVRAVGRALVLLRIQLCSRCGAAGGGRRRVQLALQCSPLLHTACAVINSNYDTTFSSCLKASPAASGKFWKEIEACSSSGALSPWASLGSFSRARPGPATLPSPSALLSTGLAAPAAPHPPSL